MNNTNPPISRNKCGISAPLQHQSTNPNGKNPVHPVNPVQNPFDIRKKNFPNEITFSSNEFTPEEDVVILYGNEKIEILENEIIQRMTIGREEVEKGEVIDGLVYKTFATKFNKKYENELLNEQKQLLHYYVASFADNAVELKLFLNEELPRLTTALRTAQDINEIKEDEEMLTKTQSVIDRLETLGASEINEELLLTVMRTQALVKEIYNDAHNH